MKTCYKCQRSKPESDFGTDNAKKDKLKIWCKDCCRDYLNHRYKTNPQWRQRVIGHAKNYRENPNHKEAIKESQRNWVKKQRRDNPRWKALVNLRRRLAFVLNGQRRVAHSLELIGCTREQLISHLESRFTDGMTWENYGEWHIDHIKPCASFDLSQADQQKICFHYTNLQPLWAEDNLAKSDNILN